MKNAILLVCLVSALCCCGTGQDAVERQIEDGVEVVLNHLEPYRIGDFTSIRLEEIFRIDTEDETISNLGIPDIFGFAVDSRGDIYVLRNIKGEGHFIFKFDSSGEFVKSFGPQGEGPGEFQNPHHIALDKDDNVLITDYGRIPFLKYDKDGRFIGDDTRTGQVSRIAPGPGTSLLVQGMSFERGAEGPLYSINLKMLDPGFEVLSIIDKFSFSPEVEPGKIRATEPLFHWSMSYDNIYVANENRGYEIWVFEAGGALVRKIRKEYKQLPLSDTVKKKMLRQFPGDMASMVVFPDHLPPIQSLFAGDDGTLLVATFEEGAGPGEFMCDIFSADGVFIGRKSLNAFIWEGHMWARMKAGKFYCLSEKESGFKAVYVYQMYRE